MARQATSQTLRERARLNQGSRFDLSLLVPGKERVCQTFFSRAQHQCGDIVLDGDEGLPTKDVLACAQDMESFFRDLGLTALAKFNDMGGNIAKTARKYSTDPEKYTTLQSMIEDEVTTGAKYGGSAREALLWLKRACELICAFLEEIIRGEQRMKEAAKNAYRNSLKRHHSSTDGWFISHIIPLGVPNYDEFMKSLGSDGSEASTGQVFHDMTDFTMNLRELCDILNHVLIKHNIETPA